MLVLTMTEFFKSQKMIFEVIESQDIIIKRKRRFYQLVDLGYSIPDVKETKISPEDLDQRIKHGIETYKHGRTEELDPTDIKNFFNL
jgi:hypothetical protein